MLRVLRMFPFSQAAIKLQLHGGALRRGVGGDRRLRLFSLPPRRLRRGETPACGKDQLWLERPAGRSRPFGATLHRCWVEQLGGAPAGAQSYWQGRFAACTFVERVWHTGRPRNSWGVAPNPTRELRPLTPQGALPLDPFFAPRLERARLIVRTCCPYPKSASRTRRCPGRHRAPPSPSNPVSDPHTRGLSPPKLSHCPTISAGMSQF
mgnify:CR=1 FL=1